VLAVGPVDLSIASGHPLTMALNVK
jgi:hypothetical protein